MLVLAGWAGPELVGLPRRPLAGFALANLLTVRRCLVLALLLVVGVVGLPLPLLHLLVGASPLIATFLWVGPAQPLVPAPLGAASGVALEMVVESVPFFAVVLQ